jgi:hypothetical protein
MATRTGKVIGLLSTLFRLTSGSFQFSSALSKSIAMVCVEKRLRGASIERVRGVSHFLRLMQPQISA